MRPEIGPEDQRVYKVKAPLATHFRKPSPEEVRSGKACELVDCPPYRKGWRLRWDVLTDRDRHLATNCGRSYKLVEVSELEHWLVFPAGQPCFRATDHMVRLEEEPVLGFRDGRNRPVFLKDPSAFMDDLHEHTDKIEQLRKDL